MGRCKSILNLAALSDISGVISRIRLCLIRAAAWMAASSSLSAGNKLNPAPVGDELNFLAHLNIKLLADLPGYDDLVLGGYRNRFHANASRFLTQYLSI